MAHHHIILIGVKVGGIIIYKLDTAGSIACKGISHFIALTDLAGNILLQFDFPPIGRHILGCHSQSSGSIHTGRFDNRTISPDIEGTEAGCNRTLRSRRCLRLLDFFHRDLGKQQLALTQATQFQTAVAVAAGFQIHGKGVLAHLHIVFVGAVVSSIVIDKLNAARSITAEGKLNAIVAATLGLKCLLQLYFPPIGSSIGVDQFQALCRLGSLSRQQCAFGPGINTGERILFQQFFQFFLVHFLEVHISKGQLHIAAVTQLTQFQAGTLLDTFIGSEIEGCNANIAVYPLGLGADHGCSSVINGKGHVLIFGAFFGENKGRLVGLALHQIPVHCQFYAPALVGPISGNQVTVSILHHIAGGLIRHIQEIGIQIRGQFFTSNGAEVQLKLVQGAQFQRCTDFTIGILACGEPHYDLVFTGLHFVLIAFVVGSALAGKSHHTGSITGETIYHFIVSAPIGVYFLGQADALRLPCLIVGGQGNPTLSAFYKDLSQTRLSFDGDTGQAVLLAAPAHAIYELVGVRFGCGGSGFNGGIGCFNRQLLFVAAHQSKHANCRQQYRQPFDHAAFLTIHHGFPSYIHLVLSCCRQKFFHIFFGGHHPQGALSGGNQCSRGIGKGKHFQQIFPGEMIHSVLQDIVEYAGTECISRAGGFNGIFLQERPCLHLQIFVVSPASVLSQGQQDQRNVVSILQNPDAFIKVFLTGEPLDLVIGNLQHITPLHTKSDLLLGLLQCLPQRGAEIGVISDQTSIFFCNFQRLCRCFPDTGMGHGKRAKMEDLRLCNQILINLLRTQIHVCTGIPIEGEIPVTVRISVNECQSGMYLVIHQQIPGIDTHILNHGFQMVSQKVVAYFSNKGGFFTQFCEHCQHIAGCAAGIGLHQVIPLAAESVFGEVDEQFAQSCNMIIFHEIIPPQTVRTWSHPSPPGHQQQRKYPLQLDLS